MIFRKLALKEKIFYETTLIYTHIEATYIYKVYTYIYIYSTILYNIKMYKLLVQCKMLKKRKVCVKNAERNQKYMQIKTNDTN